MDVRPRYSLTTGIPAVRVGWLVGKARREAGLDERALARAAGVSKRIVRRWEAARQVPCDSEVEAIARACRRSLADLLPPRDVVEFDAGARFLRVGGHAVSVAEVHNDAVLSTFVALVREQRQLAADDKVTFRQPDLDVLSEALDLEDEDLESRLLKIAGLDANDAAEVRRRLLRRRLAMPAVGLLAGSWGLTRMAAANGDHPATPVNDGAPAAVATAPLASASASASASGSASPSLADAAPAVPTAAPLLVVVGDDATVTTANAPAAAPAGSAPDTVTAPAVAPTDAPAGVTATTPEPAPAPVTTPRPVVRTPRPTPAPQLAPAVVTDPASEAVIADAVEVVNLRPDPGTTAA